MNDILTMRTELANDFAVSGAKLLTFTMTAGALAAIPDTHPQQYVVAGTLENIQKILPVEDTPGRRKDDQRPTEPLTFDDDASPVAPEQDQADSMVAEMERLHNALCFWLPQSHAGLPDAMQERIAADAYLLVGYDDSMDGKQSAEELGWIDSAAHIASKPSRTVTHPDGSTSTFITEREEHLELQLAELRDLFPMPDNAELHALWMDACGDPDAVAPYVKAQVESLRPAATPAASAPTKFDDYPEYNFQAMGCGLEDKGITDRYDAMRYGWNEAIERVGERIDNFLSDLAPTASADAVIEARDLALEEAATLCDVMNVTSPRKQYQEAAEWLAHRIRKLKSGVLRTGEGDQHA